MPDFNMVIYEEDLVRLEKSLGGLRQDANARFVFLIDRSGQQLGCVGDTDTLDTTSLSSLTAGNVAATEGLAQLIGESNFASLFHEGKRENLHITLINQDAILLVAFDERSSLGLVRLRVAQASEGLGGTLAEISRRQQERRASDGASPLSEITDEDIDSLFSD
jgi:predicted regulator of Ras-like GTPase activity (Roadblock/LC7/MglB family)